MRLSADPQDRTLTPLLLSMESQNTDFIICRLKKLWLLALRVSNTILACVKLGLSEHNTCVSSRITSTSDKSKERKVNTLNGQSFQEALWVVIKYWVEDGKRLKSNK